MSIGRSNLLRTSCVVLIACVLTASCSAESDQAPSVTDSQLRDYLDAIEAAVEGPDSEEWIRRSLEQEEQIAGCMRDEGFDYVPVPAHEGAQGAGDVDFAVGIGTREWASRNGYGISTSPVYAMVDENTDAGADVPAGETGEHAFEEDPNTEIFDALTPSEQDAYQAALYGKDYALTDEELAERGAGAIEGRGCAGRVESLSQVDAEQLLMDADVMELYEAVSAMTLRAEGDPAVQDLIRRWSECMGEHGQPGFSRPSDPPAHIVESLDALISAAVKAEKSDEGRAGGDPVIDLDGIDREKLHELNREERALASTDFMCSASTGLDEGLSEVRARLENEYVREHRDDLERMMLLIDGSR